MLRGTQPLLNARPGTLSSFRVICAPEMGAEYLSFQTSDKLFFFFFFLVLILFSAWDWIQVKMELEQM